MLWSLFVSMVVLLAVGASQIKLEEDITKFFPDDDRVKELNYVLQHSRFSERLVVMVSTKDSSYSPQPDSLVAVAEQLVSRITTELHPHIRTVVSKVDDSKVMDVFATVQEHLPIFLTDRDYKQLDSLIQPEVVNRVLQQHYRQLVSPAGLVTKKIIVNDPLGFSFIVLKKLQELQYDENFELYNNYIVTRDKRHLVFFIHSAYAPNDTKQNTKLVAGLNAIINDMAAAHPEILTSYFGSSAVAVGNATQLRQDTWLTVCLTVALLFIFLVGFFRKIWVPLLIFIPVLFGGLFSLCCIYLVQGSVSILAVAAGSVILGIAINYSLHFLVHLQHTGSCEEVVKDLTRPMTLGSATTVLAFFCLQFTNAAVLRDVGLFAGFSLIGAALCSLIFLPHLIHSSFTRHQNRSTWLERTSLLSFGHNWYLVILILLLTPLFFYFAQQITFNSDMRSLNFMQEGVRTAEARLEAVTKASLSSVYIVSNGKNLEEAFRKMERTVPILTSLEVDGMIHTYAAVSAFLISDSLQQVRINRWNAFWTPEKKKNLVAHVRLLGSKLNFSETVFKNFERLLYTEYTVANRQALQPFREAFFDDYIIEKENRATVITLANVSAHNKDYLYQQIKTAPVQAFDRQMLTNLFVAYVHDDFTFIVTFTSLLVFVALLVSYGRIELTLIAFVPMLITWIWILGIMKLAGIEFNIVNVMISTFIFGLGDDYSIFTMDGLQREYATGKKNLPSIRSSIFVSAITTICGLGVLIFAQHPALRSIAAIAIIGIVCVFVMSQTVEPFLFHWLISNRVKKGLTPMTFAGIVKTFLTYFFFVTGSFFLTVVGLMMKLIPAGRGRVRLVYHSMIRFYTLSLVYGAVNLKKKIIGKTPQTFSRASVVVSNHSSFLDILLTTMLHPKLILLTNKWVWNSPVFGGVVRLADYYPVMDGAEDSTDRLRDRVLEGYSVVVFPEGTRSPDGKIKRFHKGAFYMAEVLNLPVQPLLIHGAKDGICKNDIYLNDSHITLKFLPAIEPADKQYGEMYSERTKNIGRYFRDEYNKLAGELETPDYFRYKLITNYIYKGPVLEWYLRIKLSLEKNYAPFHALIPRKATILDLGCGYGFLCYMLQFLSDERMITGVDYDPEKIDTAQYGFRRSNRLNFVCHDITTYPLEKYDVILMNDVLHYLPEEKQILMLRKTFAALHPGGRVIIREGNAELKDKHWGTQLSEFFSVTVLGFNKSVNALQFLSGETIQQEAKHHGLHVSIQDDTKYTSNVIFVISEPGADGING